MIFFSFEKFTNSLTIHIRLRQLCIQREKKKNKNKRGSMTLDRNQMCLNPFQAISPLQQVPQPIDHRTPAVLFSCDSMIFDSPVCSQKLGINCTNEKENCMKLFYTFMLLFFISFFLFANIDAVLLSVHARLRLSQCFLFICFAF